MLQRTVKIAGPNNTKSDWTGVNNHKEENEECEEKRALNQVISSLLLEVQKEVSGKNIEQGVDYIGCFPQSLQANMCVIAPQTTRRLIRPASFPNIVHYIILSFHAAQRVLSTPSLNKK
jgi:hypothetical protein